MKPEEIWSIWNEVVDVDMGFDPVPFANAIIDAVPTIGLERISQVLACEIECGIFEQHVAPALDIARKTLSAPTHGADARPVAITEVMAEEMGANGSPHSEPERLLFEAYCKGHCWAVGEWNGQHYVDMADRIRFAYWRDRAALATRDSAPSDGPNAWADLWYFVMDEAPMEFERIVTTVSSSQWHSEAHKLMRAKYPIAPREKT